MDFLEGRPLDVVAGPALQHEVVHFPRAVEGLRQVDLEAASGVHLARERERVRLSRRSLEK